MRSKGGENQLAEVAAWCLGHFFNAHPVFSAPPPHHDQAVVDGLNTATPVVLHIAFVQLLVTSGVSRGLANAVLRIFLGILGQPFHHPGITAGAIEPFGDSLLPWLV